MNVSEKIIEKIKLNGPVSFHDFMEMALYYPDFGYYTSSSKKIGKEGDYFTSPYATAIFGEMIARQLKEMWHLCGEGEFAILEYGAGEGSLCHDILSALKKHPAFFEQVKYCIIEKSPAMQARQRALLKDEKITWLESSKGLRSFTGCVLANELIDNFSVHLVEMHEYLMEVFVDYQGEFREVLRPASASLVNYLRDLNVDLPQGFRTEINLEAMSWITEVASVINKGFLLVVDYGYSKSAFYSSKRSAGTLLSYYKHTINDRFYEHIGEQDITAHVNFSALKDEGVRNELQFAGFTEQAMFLRALGFNHYLKELETDAKNNAAADRAELAAAYRFMINMGQKLKVLIMYKNTARPQFSGLQFLSELE